MERKFWQERWERREIGFHRSDIHWALERHWAEILTDPAERVLVPLCGKSLDTRWIGERGHEVVGVVLSERAIREFYEEWGAHPARAREGSLIRWQAGTVAIVEGDFWRVTAQ